MSKILKLLDKTYFLDKKTELDKMRLFLITNHIEQINKSIKNNSSPNLNYWNKKFRLYNLYEGIIVRKDVEWHKEYLEARSEQEYYGI